MVVPAVVVDVEVVVTDLPDLDLLDLAVEVLIDFATLPALALTPPFEVVNAMLDALLLTDDDALLSPKNLRVIPLPAPIPMPKKAANAAIPTKIAPMI